MSANQLTGSLSVGQLAARAGIRSDTIRYYERTGLLPPPRRTGGDHRRYDTTDLDRLLFIRGAQRLGLRLAEIRELLTVRDTGDCACQPAETFLRSHLDEIDREIARLATLHAELTGMLAAMPGPGCSPATAPAAKTAAERRRPAPRRQGGTRKPHDLGPHIELARA